MKRHLPAALRAARAWCALLLTKAALLVVVTFAVFAGAWYAWKPCDESLGACAPLDCDIDSDLDGLPDRLERDPGPGGRATDPRYRDTDDDGLLDGLDPCPLMVGPLDAHGRCPGGADPRPPYDADRDGLADHLEGHGPFAGTRADTADSDGDGQLDGRDPCPGAHSGPAITDPSTTDPSTTDPSPTDPSRADVGHPDHPRDDTTCQSGRPVQRPWHQRTTLAEKYYCWADNVLAGRVSRADGMPLMPSVISGLWQTLVLVGTSLLVSATAAILLVMLLHALRARPTARSAIETLLGSSFVPIVLVGYLIGAAVNSSDFQVFRSLDPALASLCLDGEHRVDLFALFTVNGCLGDYAAHLAIPAIVLALGDGNLGYLVRDLTRNLDEVDRSPYVDYARVRGVDRRRIALWYLIPNVAVLSLIFLRQRAIFLLSGVVIVERMFGRHGLGKMLIDALSDSHDLPLLLTCATVFFAVAIAIQLMVRLAATLIERRATL